MSSAAGGNAGHAEAGRDGALVDDAVRGQRAELAVVDDEAPGRLRLFQGPAHDRVRFDRPSVVREGDGPGRDEVADVDEFLAGRAAGDGRNGQDVGQTGPAGLGQDPFGRLAPVIDGAGVGHGADRREAAADGGPDAGPDGLLGFVPGLPQMDVHIDETGDDDEAAAVDRPGRSCVDRRTDRRDPPAVEEDIEEAVEPFRRADDAGAAKEDHRVPARPMRTGSAMKISSLPSVSLRRTRTRSRWEVGRTLPT